MKRDKESTARALMAIATELADTMAAAERLRVQIAALAAAHGVAVPMG
jgi:hypothetical protein